MLSYYILTTIIDYNLGKVYTNIKLNIIVLSYSILTIKDYNVSKVYTNIKLSIIVLSYYIFKQL